jgi:alpha-tubulin suppressor-like RCC1 family protein
MPTPTEIQTCIDALTTACDSINFPLLAAQTSDAGTGISFSVNSVSDLPDQIANCIGEGQIVFVKSLCVPVISTQTGWQGLDGQFVRRDGVWYFGLAWGSNTCGQLGNNTTTTTSSPVREITSSLNWCQIAGGGCHTAGIKQDGTLWTWGLNDCGQLGDCTLVQKSSPVREITSSSTWCRVSAGACHTSGIKTDGALWSWGNGGYGQLGFGGSSSQSAPVQEATFSTTWCQVAAGFRHTAGVKTDGSLWAWGSNCCGALGDGTITTRLIPVREISSSTNWCQVSAAGGFFGSTGGKTTSAVKTDGTLWSWGYNACGQLGNNSTVDRCSPVREITSSTTWRQVSVGSAHTAAIKTDGSLWAWGYNGVRGVLGAGFAGTGSRFSSPIRESSSSTTWCQVSAGYLHSGAVKTDGSLWTWGFNGCGQLGDGTSLSRASPVREISCCVWCQVSAGGRFTTGIMIP